MTDRSAGFKPALAYHVLTPLYDRVVALTVREQAFKPALVAQASIQPGHDVLDVGCGTGTLALLAAATCPQARVTGLDADPTILALARRKAAGAAVSVRFDQGLSTDLPYGDGSFDRAMTSLFFHHLAPANKETTARQMHRVLRVGGQLHVADWGRARGPISRTAFFAIQLLDGFETTRDAVAGRLPSVLAQAGFAQVADTRCFITAFGILSLYRATK